MAKIDITKLHIGDVVLVDSRTKTTRAVQKWLGFGTHSRWTHVGGSIGGLDMVEGAIPKSRVCNIQTRYVDKGYDILILRPQYQSEEDRIKVALWWATMNNTPYDLAQLFWYPLVALVGKKHLKRWNFFSRASRLICSELIAEGFMKQGYNFFNKPTNEVVPADFATVNFLEINVFTEVS